MAKWAEVARIAKVSVDGAEIQGMSTDLPGDKKQVKVEVKAAGYRSAEKKLDLAALLLRQSTDWGGVYRD